MATKIGLALGGGAARGIAHIGVLQAFADHGIPVDCITGTSAGAIVAASFAFGVPLDRITEKARALTWYSLSNFPISKLGLASNGVIEKMMEEVIGPADITEAKIPLAIVAADIESGEKVVFRRGKVATMVRASSCIPGMFAPVEVGARKLVDGGITENVPLSPLREMGAKILIGVDVTHWHSERKVGNVLDVMANAIDILANHQTNVAHRLADVLIMPDLGAYSPSDFKKADELVHAGYRAAMKKMPEIREAMAKHGVGGRRENVFVRFGRWLSG